MNAGISNRPWWQTTVIYQIYPRSFQDSNGDGIGDLPGIIRRLPYLAETLGIESVWISPFFTSPMKDFGYDVADFTDVDPIFGSFDDARQLIVAIHDQGMRVIFDFVSNHSSDQHRWFQESRSSREAAKRNWYVWRDPAPDGGPPNNWLSVFGGPAWTFDEVTGQYYLHSFLTSQPDLNWREPDLRDAMHEVLRFWLDLGVDGFRIDAAHFVGKDERFRDNPPAMPDARFMHKPMGAYDRQLHLYDKGLPFTHSIYREFRRLLESYSSDADERLMIGEMHIYDWQEWASYFGAALDEFHLPYNFGLLNTNWSAQEIATLIKEIESVLPDGAWPNWVIGNHDEQRVATRLGTQQARAAMALLLTLRGTPTIYYGDELGMPDAVVPPEMRQDPWGLQVQDVDNGRDPQRAPMLWTTGENGDFAEKGVTPWLPVVEPAVFSVESQINDDASMLTLTRKLLALRKARPSLSFGSIDLLTDLPSDSLGFIRTSGHERTLVLVSFDDSELPVNLNDSSQWSQIMSTMPDAKRPEPIDNFRLHPHEAAIFAENE